MFDMDGVLVDGEPLHFRAVNTLLAEEGKAMSLDEYRPYMGTKSGWREMMQPLGLTRDISYYSQRYDEIVLAEYRECSVPLPGAVALVRALEAAGVPIGVCSSSRLSWVEACLSRLGLLDAFDSIVTGSEVERGKPAPDIYLLAAERLGAEPRDCLAIEDAPAGIESAQNAGMTVWAVWTEYTRGLTLPDPDRTLDSLEDIAIEEVLGVAA